MHIVHLNLMHFKHELQPLYDINILSSFLEETLAD